MEKKTKESFARNEKVVWFLCTLKIVWEKEEKESSKERKMRITFRLFPSFTFIIIIFA